MMFMYVIYTAFHQHFGSGVWSASFVFNWSCGRAVALTRSAQRCTQRKHGTYIDFMWRRYQIGGEMPYTH